jgi:hypothetical protein
MPVYKLPESVGKFAKEKPGKRGAYRDIVRLGRSNYLVEVVGRNLRIRVFGFEEMSSS